jgi:hypothetical protein
MPVAKRRAECASKCCLEGILSAWDFIKGLYRYEYIYWCLKQFFTVNKPYIRDIFGSWLKLLPFGPMYSILIFVPGPAIPLA